MIAIRLIQLLQGLNILRIILYLSILGDHFRKYPQVSISAFTSYVRLYHQNLLINCKSTNNNQPSSSPQMQSSTSTSSPTPKQIPFKQIRPIKYMGISSSLPFNSLISDSKLIYFSGRSIILQNIKTYEQKPIWTNQFEDQPQVIEHIINIHRQNIVGIAIKDQSQNHLIIIMNINSQINNYEHLSKKEREKDRLHYLKTVPGETTTVQKLKFLHEGSLFAVVISQNDHKAPPSKSIFIHSSMSGQLLYSCSFSSSCPLIQGLQLSRQNYICIIKNEPQEDPSDSFLQSKKSFYNYKRLSSSNPSSVTQKPIGFFTMTLINSSELSSKNDFLVELNSGQFIVEVRFFQNHKKTFAFLLLNSGFLLVYMINDRGFHDAIRVDIRIDKEKHLLDAKNNKKTTFSTEKSQQNDNSSKPQCRKSPRRNNEQQQSRTIEKLMKRSLSSNIDNCSESDSDQTNTQKQGTLKLPQSRQRLSTIKSVSSTSASQYFMPVCICCTNCKVVIGYENCSFIGLVTYSAVDHRHYKFRYISDFFSSKPYIQAIRKINFSEDGCHSSVLVKVNPHKVEALKKKKRGGGRFDKYGMKNYKASSRNNRLKGEQFTEQTEDVNSPNKLTKDIKNKCLKNAHTSNKLCAKQQSRIQKRARIMNPKKSSEQLSHALTVKNKQQQEDGERQHFALMHIDFISGMIEHEYHTQSIEQSLTSTSLNGLVEYISFNDMNNTMLVLMNDNRLYYYYLNPTNIHTDKEMANSAKANINLAKKKLQANGIFAQRSINNYLSPDNVLLWVDKLKLKPSLILCHPFMFELLLVFHDNLKFHFYNSDKIFESHHILNIKNCKAASFSPFGDKLALGTTGSIWLVDSYTHSVIKKISLVIFPSDMKTSSNPHSKIPHDKSENETARRSESVFMSLSSKTVSRIQYINNDDIMIQTGNTTISMLLNYDKVIYYGSTSEAIQGQLLCYDFKHRLGVIASDTSVKVITKCSINSKNKCEQLAKIDLSVTALKLCGDIDILFLGGANGVLYFIRWPQFFQNDTIKAPNTNSKLHLFHCPIVDIQISINYRQLFVMSKEGTMVICQLMHSDEVEKIGKDVSYVMSKKIDLPLPLANKWLISTSDEEKRAQNITKLMGNQAEIKNNEALLSEQYRVRLEKLSMMQKHEIEEQLKNQIRQYEEESGISKLQLQIVSVRDEIKRMIGKREVESKKINQEIDEDLHKVFVERQKLQKEFKQLTAQTSEKRTHFQTKIHNELSGYQNLTKMQLQQDKKFNQKAQKMFENKIKIDKALQQNTIEDYMDELYQVKKIYTQQLDKVYLKNNQLNSLNRNKKVEISLITDKMRQLSARMYELENDCNQLQNQNQKVNSSKKTLSLQISQTDKKYHALIKKTKEIQITLNKTRTSSEACQLNFDDLERQMQLLHERWNYLERKREQSEIDFSEQFKLRNLNLSQTQEVKQKIQQLKAKRKHSFETNVLLKGLIKPYEKQFNAINFAYTTDPGLIACIDSSMIELKKYKTNKLTSDVEKWNNVKNDNKRKFIKYNQRLQEENNKLVYRFNELQKEFKELVNFETHLKGQITIQKQKEAMQSNKWQKFSFVQKQLNKDAQTTQKITSISVHRLSCTTDNLRMTSYDSTSKSLQRDLVSNDNLRKTGFMLKGMVREIQVGNKLGKKGSTNLQGLIQEKRQLFKQRKQNGQHLYHGVTLDKETLKPKKTLCLSLHQEGQESGKFVTQY